MNITLAVVTSNDEKIIGRFMEHHKPHVDEIVWADDCSTDKTREIAQKYADKSILSEMRNYSCEFYRQKLMELSSNDWVLMLDSDQFVDFSILSNLRNLIEEAEKKNINSYGATFTNICFVKCPACNTPPSNQIAITNRKYIRWSIFPHVGSIFLDGKDVPGTPNIGIIWHLPVEPGIGEIQHHKEHIIRMRRWIDVCRYCVRTYTDEFYKIDRQKCIYSFKNIGIDILNDNYDCSKDNKTLIWIENDDDLWEKLEKARHGEK
jgi:glycosyltransferase involved in cell wall biosynthesis